MPAVCLGRTQYDLAMTATGRPGQPAIKHGRPCITGRFYQGTNAAGALARMFYPRVTSTAVLHHLALAWPGQEPPRGRRGSPKCLRTI